MCYLYDYGDEWRFYLILMEVYPDGSPYTEPLVVKEKGEEIDPYGDYVEEE